MTVVAVAIALSFHLTSEPSELEKSVSRPLGFLFWVLALAMLFLGLANYIGTRKPTKLDSCADDYPRHGKQI